ncbi:bifunctional riboflavin biosynthesis protein RIBA 1, chloroplastic-like protein [Tanacetum coccineum]
MQMRIMRDVRIREEVRREVLSFLEIDWLAGHQRSKEARPSQQQRQNTLPMSRNAVSNPLDEISAKVYGFLVSIGFLCSVITKDAIALSATIYTDGKVRYSLHDPARTRGILPGKSPGLVQEIKGVVKKNASIHLRQNWVNTYACSESQKIAAIEDDIMDLSHPPCSTSVLKTGWLVSSSLQIPTIKAATLSLEPKRFNLISLGPTFPFILVFHTLYGNSGYLKSLYDYLVILPEHPVSDTKGDIGDDAGRGVYWYTSEVTRVVALEQVTNFAHITCKMTVVTLLKQMRKELSLPVDSREYGIGAQILRDVGVEIMKLMTNNVVKYNGLKGYGLEFLVRVPFSTTISKHNKAQQEIS